PYSSAKDPVNMAGFAAQNQLDGLISFADWDEVEKNPKAVLLDIREKPEIRISPLAGALQIPFGELRSRLNELDKAKTYIVFCTIGVRSYTAARALTQLGFENVKVYPGGTLFYHSIHVPEKQD
ncbi:MAG: rhodanese-like domain-containing protein, partial [Bacillota bacterium]|nr:rhodanese-like domain-containing protein [Bacillota bacterium]